MSMRSPSKVVTDVEHEIQILEVSGEGVALLKKLASRQDSEIAVLNRKETSKGSGLAMQQHKLSTKNFRRELERSSAAASSEIVSPGSSNPLLVRFASAPTDEHRPFTRRRQAALLSNLRRRHESRRTLLRMMGAVGGKAQALTVAVLLAGRLKNVTEELSNAGRPVRPRPWDQWEGTETGKDLAKVWKLFR
jgi:hypothetical protein